MLVCVEGGGKFNFCTFMNSLCGKLRSPYLKRLMTSHKMTLSVKSVQSYRCVFLLFLYCGAVCTSINSVMSAMENLLLCSVNEQLPRDILCA